MFFNKTEHNKISLITCGLVFFIANLDTSILSSAFPAISSDFNVSFLKLKSLLVGFLLSYTLAIPLVEYLVNKYGLRLVFLLSCLGFLFSSIVCATSQTLVMLIAARIIQGFAAGCFIPISRSVVIDMSSPENLPNNFNNIQTIGLLGFAFGPFVGGYITNYIGWRYIFWINIPICIFTFYLIYISVFNKEQKQKHIKFDKIGYLYISLIFIALMLLSEYLQNEKSFFISLVFISIFIIFTIADLKLLKKHIVKIEHPIINYKVFNNKLFKLYSICSLVGRQYVACTSFILLIIFGAIFNYNSIQIGNLLSVFGLGIWFSKLPLKLLLKKYSVINLLLLSCILFLFCSILGIFILINYHTNTFLKLLIVFIFGGLSSNVTGFFNILSFSKINKKLSLAASTIASLIIFTSQSTSIAIFALVVNILSIFFNIKLSIMLSSLLMSIFLLYSTIYLYTLKTKEPNAKRTL